MASDVEDILAAVHCLPPREQREILRRLAESLTTDDAEINRATEDFWKSRTIDEIVHEQHVSPVYDLNALAFSDWPEDETVEDFVAYVYGQRRTERGA